MTTIGKDLAVIRKHLNLDLEDIHHKTRIPLETLHRIEDGSLLADSSENIIYIRSFIRTYTKALKIDEELVLKSLDQHEVGIYNGLLLESYPELMPEKPKKTGETEKKTEGKQKKEPEAPDKTMPKENKTGQNEKKRKVSIQSKPGTSDFTSTYKPAVKDEKWAKVGHMVSSRQKTTPVWIIGVIVIIIITLISIYFIYQSDLFGEDESIPQLESESPQSGQVMEGSELSLEFGEIDPAESASATLDDTLYITLYAAYDKLEPVRVWSDLKPRIDPYWLEEGMAMNFEFMDTIRINGQYNRMLLFLNGHRIDNFRLEYYNQEEAAVELTRSLFENDQNLWATPVPFEIPEDASEPDSVQFRPLF
jgi:cytoskeletal protein RodZ